MIKTYVIKVKVDTEDVKYNEIEQQLYDLDVQDVDLIEEYND